MATATAAPERSAETSEKPPVVREVDDRGGEVVHGAAGGDERLTASLEASVNALEERIRELRRSRQVK